MDLCSPGRDSVRISLVFYQFLVLLTISNSIFGLSVKELRHDFTITEGVDPGTLVGEITLNPNYSYRVNDQSSWFNFDTKTGRITCTNRLDRESLPSDRLDLVILGTPDARSSNSPTLFISVRVSVIDVNDNAPIFPFPFQNVSVPESARLGSQIVLPSATDPDSGENGRIAKYEIISGNDEQVFKLSRTAEDRQQSTGTLLLLVNKPLNREDRSIYHLNISATDAGSPSILSGHLTLFVNVLDANDNAPEFDMENFHVTVSERVGKGQPILTVSAKDMDKGHNAKISYQLSGRREDHQFRIDSITGDITSKVPKLDCPESQCPSGANSNCSRLCVFSVEATDGGVPSQRGRAFVHVKIRDENDHDPQILFRMYPSAASQSATVSEEKAIGHVVAVVTVLDEDTGSNGKTTVRIENGNELNHFRLEANQEFSLLRINALLDRKKISYYNLTISATDQGQPPRSSRRFLPIYVRDANDKPPEFTAQLFTANITTSAPIGSYVTSLTANQKLKSSAQDIFASGSKLTFDFLSGNEKGLLALNRRTGLVTVAQSLSELPDTKLNLRVSVKGTSPGEVEGSITKLKVAIVPSGNTAPVFSRSVYDVSLREDAIVGTTIVHLTASDSDFGAPGQLRFDIDAQFLKEHPDVFLMTSDAGIVRLGSSINRELISLYRIPVKVTDGGDPPLSAQSEILLHVDDVNDNRPEIYPNQYFVNALSSFTPGSLITQIKAMDVDSGVNSHIQYYLADSPPVLFSVDQNSGRLTLNGKLLAPSKLALSVSVVDGGNLQSATNATINIFAIEDLAHSPTFPKNQYEFTVPEDSGVSGFSGRAVGTVSATDFDQSGQIEYHLVGGDKRGQFEIGQFSGEIRSSAILDREVQELYDLKVVAVGQSAVAHTSVLIDLEDVNDNQPMFISHQIKDGQATAVIHRDWAIGHSIFYASATDADVGDNGRLTYSMTETGEGLFSIHPTTGRIGLAVPSVLLPLDKDSHRLTVQVTDNGTPPKTNAFRLYLHVLPSITHSDSVVLANIDMKYSIPENTPMNTLIDQMKTIPAKGHNVLFSSVDEVQDSPFSIFPDGWIYVKNSLDYETRTFYTMKVMMKQGGSDGVILKSTATISFSIIDVNDNSPMCLPQKSIIQMSEGLPPLSYVGSIAAEDRDSGLNGKLNYQLLKGSEFFRLDRTSGELRTLKTFDRETLMRTGGTKMFIRVQVSDQGSESHVTECELQVQVVDKNDERPQFSLEMYHASLAEDMTVGSSILQVTATDADLDVNGRIEYKILDGNHDGQFNIGRDDGQLMLAKPLDRELIDEHRLTIGAEDSGIPKLNATTYATVRVTDVNDETPQFIEFPSNGLNVSESVAIGSFIAQFTAVDSDLGPSGSIQYILASGNVGTVFDLDVVTGTLYNIRALDLEKTPAYTLTITALDRGNPPLKSTVPLLINIIDANDNAPIIHSSSLIGQVSEDAPMTSSVMQVTAIDADHNQNGLVRYQIVHQSPQNGFKINPESGLITSAMNLDRESIPAYSLKIRASDSPIDPVNQLFTDRTINIIVTDANDHAPEFVGPHASIIRLTDSVNRRISKVAAKDADAGLNSSIGFRIIDGNSEGLFRLNPDGSLYLQRQLNNAKSMYLLTLEAMDRMNTTNGRFSADQRTTSMQFALISMGLSNQGLRFSEDVYHVEVIEDTSIGTQISSLKASFTDRNNQGPIEYYVTDIISSGAISLPVDVDPQTGIVRVIRPLDREQSQSITITVVAVVPDSPKPLATACEVHVNIIDVNDEPPVASKSQYDLKVPENHDPSVSLTTITATDPDSYSRLQFKLSDETILKIDENTGEVTLKVLLDREEEKSYSTSVLISDGVHTTSVPIVVEILDVNDNKPDFQYPKDSLKEYSFHVLEGSALNSFVGHVNAIDFDEGENGNVRYEILEGNDDRAFLLDSQIGIITVNGFIDYERHPIYHLTIAAVDNGSPPLRRTSSVTIMVKDVNDNPPIFTPNEYSVSLFENATAMTQLVVLKAVDKDIGSDLHYSITSGDPWNQFHITSNGTLTLVKPVDRETRPTHQLTVTVYDARPSAVDSDKTVHKDTATVLVTVLDVNDNAPQFVSEMNVILTHGSGKDSPIIAFLEATDADEGLNGQIQYQIDSKSASDFAVDPVMGHVTLLKPIQELKFDQNNVSVWAVDSGSPDRMKTLGVLNVQIVSSNSIAPRFKESRYEINVGEDTPAGTSLLQLSLADMDLASMSFSQFWVSSGDAGGDFLVTPDTGIVSVARELDFEHTQVYNITVKVSNPTVIPKDDHSATLIINLVDVNDVAPVFMQNPMQIQVVENLEGVVFPAPIGLISAQDSDSGLNGKMSFSIISGNSTVFRIDSMSGLLSLTTPLDRENMQNYTLIVQATDSGVPRHLSTCTVLIEVLDANDNNPQFDQPYYMATVPEDALKGSKVIKITAVDQDQGENGRVSYKLKPSLHANPFTIDERTGIISVSEPLDRELEDTYILEVVAYDAGQGIPKSTSNLVTVLINDVNDNPPVIANQRREVFVRDSVAPGEFVYAVEVSDLDSGNNSQLIFSISGADAQTFTIDQSNGVIRARRDLSSQKDYSLNVQVSDNGIPPKRTKASINIHTRRSANFPVFKSAGTVQSFQVSEYDRSSIIVIAAARSPKPSPLGRLHYSIISGNSNQAFNIDPLTGKVTPTINLDREMQDNYELWLSATDGDSPELSAFMPVRITVTDENDHAPRFGQPLYHVTISEDAIPLTKCVIVEASDKDSGPNAQITYSILPEGNLENIFMINRKTGVIKTTNMLDREKVSSYRLIVKAQDGGDPSLESEAVVVIDLLDVNDNSPKFTRLFMSSVAEDAAIGTVVTQVTSSDLDSLENSNNTYYLSSNPGEKFAIDPVTGELTVADDLDRETVSEYPLKVIAVDGSWRIETSVMITIDDVNDQTPVFSKEQYRFSVAEMQPVLTEVGRVMASDFDEDGQNSQIRYSLQMASKLFRIDPITGDITTLSPLQHIEDRMTHDLTVLATDHGTPQLESKAHVEIIVTKKNVHSPKFFSIDYETAVTNSTPIGSRLVHVKATDADVGINGNITYEIQAKDQQGSGVITIDPESGWVTTARTIRQPENTKLAYLILAKDGGNPAKSVMAALIIYVASTNAHSPSFTSRKFEATVKENGPIGQQVLHVKATDKDHGINGNLMYRLETSPEGVDVFKLDQHTGLITTNQSLDYEIKPSYELTLIAEDKGWPKREAEAKITVQVLNKNDNPPEFQNNIMEAYIPENSPKGSLVYVLSANDVDKNLQDTILYAIIGGEGAAKFGLDEITGQLTLAENADLDYETANRFELKVQARNRIVEKLHPTALSTEATIIVHVTSKNEFKPEFEKKFYSFRTRSDAIGSIGKIYAIDEDKGLDGIVYYYLASHTELFAIDQNSGEITRLQNIQSRGKKDFIISILATNRHSESSKDQDECQVQIIIDDSSTEPLVKFTQPSFVAQVSEDAPQGTSVLSLAPYMNENSPDDIVFEITEGNEQDKFGIDSSTGFIQMNGMIDRELESMYNLSIHASTSISSVSAKITVLVLDVNDNSPEVISANRVGRIMENSPIGQSILQLMPNDKDLPPNAGPFTFSLVSNPTEFDIDHRTGIITSKVMFNREEQKIHELQVKISDSGRPQRTSKIEIQIIVGDINDSPSTNGDVIVSVIELENHEMIGNLALIPPVDRDNVGDYSCRQTPQNIDELSIDVDCQLISSVTMSKQNYELNIKGSDGVFDEVEYKLRINRDVLSLESIQETVTLFISGDPAHFLEFQQVLDSYLRSEGLESYPIALVESDDLFWKSLKYSAFVAMKKIDSKSFLPGKSAVSILQRAIGTMSGLQEVTFDLCEHVNCQNDGKCLSEIHLTSENPRSTRMDGGKGIMIYPQLTRIQSCKCNALFTGPLCTTPVDQCATGPCQNGGSCSPTLDGQPTCICPPGYDGDQCQNDVDECVVSPCRNGGFCENVPGTYKCICLLGFSGEDCQYTVDQCEPNPCFNGGECVKGGSSFHCRCSMGYSGPKCDVKSYGFTEGSYIELPSLNPHQNLITMEFATTQKDGLLLYSYNSGLGNKDYVAVDIVRGMLRLSARLSTQGQMNIMLEKDVSDGEWHQISIQHKFQMVTFSVVDCSPDAGVCETCEPGDSTCSLTANTGLPTTIYSQILVPGTSIFVGGIKNFEEIVMRPGQVSSYSFVGCMRSFEINANLLEDMEIYSKNNVLDYCPRSPESQPCLPSVVSSCGNEARSCIDNWSSQICVCDHAITAKHCDEVLKSRTFTGDGRVEYKLSEQFRHKIMFRPVAPESFVNSDDLFSHAIRNKREVVPEIIPDVLISLDFKTSLPDGMIFLSSSGQDFTMIDLVNGSLRYLSRKQTTLPLSLIVDVDQSLDDNRWHRIDLMLAENFHRVELKLDGVGKSIRVSSPLHSIIDMTTEYLSIGGATQGNGGVIVYGSNVNDFSGCLRRFILNNELQPLQKDESSYLSGTESGNLGGDCGGESCRNPPCSGTKISEGMSKNVLIIAVFCIVLIFCILVAFFLMKRFQNLRKVNSRSSSSQAAPSTKLSHIAIISQSGMSPGAGAYNNPGMMKPADSGVNLLGDGLHSLLTNNSGRTTSQTRVTPPDLDQPLYGMHRNAYENRLDPTKDERQTSPEQYDLDNASSIAPSDIDVSYHYRGFRESLGKKKALKHQPREEPARNSPLSQLQSLATRNSSSSSNQPSSVRQLKAALRGGSVNTGSSDEPANMRANHRSRPGSSHSSRSKRKTHNSSYGKSSAKSMKNNVQSVKDMRRYHSNPSFDDDGDESSSSSEHVTNNRNSSIGRRRRRKSGGGQPPKILSSSKDNDYSSPHESEDDDAMNLKHHHPNYTIEDTEPESDFCGTVPSSLAPFRPPRSMFPVSEDESASDLPITRFDQPPTTHFNHLPMPNLPHAPPIPPRMTKGPPWPHQSPQQALKSQQQRNIGQNLEAYV